MNTQFSIIGLTLFSIIWAQVGLIIPPDPDTGDENEPGDENETENENNAEPTPTPEAPATIPAAPVVQSQPKNLSNKIVIRNEGFYIAKFEIRYWNSGAEQLIQTGDKKIHYREVFEIPAGASNIQIKAWAATGLVWSPWGQIFDLALQSNDLNKCYTVKGTTLSRSWDNTCE